MGRAGRPGDEVYVTQAMGWYAPPADTAWQLLAGDLTGLPAIGRILESLPARDPGPRHRRGAGAG